MENMDKALTVPKWGLIVWPKISQMPQNLSAQFVYPSPKVLDFDEKRLHWMSIVCAKDYRRRRSAGLHKSWENLALNGSASHLL